MPTTPPVRDPSEPFQALLEPLLQRAYGAAYHMARNAADAEDLVQEAAFRAFRAFDSFEPGTNFKAWFFRILTNCYLGSYRKRRREPQRVDLDDAPPLYLLGQATGAGLIAQGEDPAALVMDRMGTETVQRAIAELPEEYRTVATLYFMEEFSYQEIAEMLGCPVGTVRSRLHRGRRMLQKALWHLAREQGMLTLKAAENA